MIRKRIKILYDYQILQFQKYGGISRYFYELFSGFTDSKDMIDVYIKGFYSCNCYFSKYIKTRKHHIFAKQINSVVAGASIWWNFLKGTPYDIIHPTYMEPSYLLRIPSFVLEHSKIVITVHDLIPEKYYKGNYPGMRDRAKYIRMADGIIAISENTKNDLLEIYPDLLDKELTVIGHGNSMRVPDTDVNIELPHKYILFVGYRTEYKNGIVVFKAFEKIAGAYPDIQLLCVGGGKFSEEEEKYFKEHDLTTRVLQLSLSDEQLYVAYQKAICFVFPSIQEGFGLPILEAFSCRCPVVLSNASCFPEIAGDAALYFEYSDSIGLQHCIQLLLENKECRQRLISEGKERLKQYTWKKTLRETEQFYCKLTEDKDVMEGEA